MLNPLGEPISICREESSHPEILIWVFENKYVDRHSGKVYACEDVELGALDVDTTEIDVVKTAVLQELSESQTWDFTDGSPQTVFGNLPLHPFEMSRMIVVDQTAQFPTPPFDLQEFSLSLRRRRDTGTFTPAVPAGPQLLEGVLSRLDTQTGPSPGLLKEIRVAARDAVTGAYIHEDPVPLALEDPTVEVLILAVLAAILHIASAHGDSLQTRLL